MKRLLTCSLAVAMIAVTAPCFAAPFVNLDFEDAVVVPHDPTFGFLDWNLAVPGWGHNSGPDTGIVYYGQGHVGTTQLYLLTDTLQPSSFSTIDGEFSLAMRSAFSPEDGEAFITQTGDIPAGTASIRLLASLGPQPPKLYFGGVQFPLAPLGVQGANMRFGANIPTLAGTTFELKIGYPILAGGVIDDISFSTQLVPEPTGAVLAGFAMAALWVARRAAQRRSERQGMSGTGC